MSVGDVFINEAIERIESKMPDHDSNLWPGEYRELPIPVPEEDSVAAKMANLAKNAQLEAHQAKMKRIADDAPAVLQIVLNEIKSAASKGREELSLRGHSASALVRALAAGNDYSDLNALDRRNDAITHGTLLADLAKLGFDVVHTDDETVIRWGSKVKKSVTPKKPWYKWWKK